MLEQNNFEFGAKRLQFTHFSGPPSSRGRSRLMPQMQQSESHISQIVSKISKINEFNILSAQ